MEIRLIMYVTNVIILAHYVAIFTAVISVTSTLIEYYKAISASAKMDIMMTVHNYVWNAVIFVKLVTVLIKTNVYLANYQIFEKFNKIINVYVLHITSILTKLLSVTNSIILAIHVMDWNKTNVYHVILWIFELLFLIKILANVIQDI